MCLRPNILGDKVGEKVHSRWFDFKYFKFLIQICRRRLSLRCFTAECSCSSSSRCCASLLDPFASFKVNAGAHCADTARFSINRRMSHYSGNYAPGPARKISDTKGNHFGFQKHVNLWPVIIECIFGPPWTLRATCWMCWQHSGHMTSAVVSASSNKE